jgi:phage regulator Rha-like protein
MKNQKALIPEGQIERSILMIRGQKVIMDSDLAILYGVETRRLNEQVKRNTDRFPEDFMFRLTVEEFENLKSHFATSSASWGGRRSLPYAFTEHGAIMVASILNTAKAIEVSVYVVRAFIRIREYLATHKQLAQKLAELEQKIGTHDQAIQSLIDAIHQLMAPPVKPKRRIGFHTDKL